MTTEIETKIANITNDPTIPAAEKQPRIDRLKDFAEKAKNEQAELERKAQADSEAALKERLKVAYMRNPAASVESFETDYPQLKSDYLRSHALANDAAVRSATSRAYQEEF